MPLVASYKGGLMPLFQRRQYQAIADKLTVKVGARDLFNRAELNEIVDCLIELFESDNSRFNADRFRAAVYRDGT